MIQPNQPTMFSLLRPLYRLFSFLIVLAIIVQVQPTMQPLSAQAGTPAAPDPVITRWDGQSRFTVMVAGLDRRPGERETLNVRTDALMLVHFDPAGQRVGILHIPRDLFFALPTTVSGETLPLVRVNTLLLRGEGMQAGSGPYYMLDTLQYNFGLYLDAYILFDFEAFTTIVDAIGGIDITTTYDIYDPTYPDMNYGYDPFYLPAGTHHLNGAETLKFARTRHGDNDYVRGVRQLQVVRAIGERATSPEVLPQLLIQAPDLLDVLQNRLYTDLTIADGINLMAFASDLPPENLVTGSLNQAYITHTVNEGESVAIPDRTKLVELLTTVFGEGYGG